MTGSNSNSRGHAIISSDAIFEGKILKAETVEVHGEVLGEIETNHLVVHHDGRVFGSTRATSASVSGQAEGELVVKELCAITETGNVVGDVRYGRLSLAQGANLEAHLRNIPPELGGDFELVVQRGQAVAITTADLTAFDPDDAAVDLTFTVSNTTAGHVARKSEIRSAISTFTQTELEAGLICFKSDETAALDGRFDVVVTDASGATSGPARTVRAKITA
ncbi:MAG: polymer-forming cytoskeletal protein [Pseudomonadota bacterium]